MEVALGLAGQGRLPRQGYPVLKISSCFQSLCPVGEARHQKDARKVKRHGQDCGSGEGKSQRAKGFPLFCSMGFFQTRFSGRMEALMLSSVLDVLLHCTLVNPSVQHLRVLHSHATSLQS